MLFSIIFQFDEIAKSVHEIKTANKFALKRLNQLINNDDDSCPLCGWYVYSSYDVAVIQ